jgi:hypothetical protein
MQELDTYQVEGTYEEMARLLGCETATVSRCCIELQRTKTADVTLGNGSVTVVSRRLKRELSGREQTRLRVQRHRCNADVTLHNKNKSNNKNKKEEEETHKAASPTPKKGTRIPDTFFLTVGMRSWAKEKGLPVDLIIETEKFCNYWRAKTGRDATKLDWEATWRNWILNARSNNGTNKQNGKRTDADVFRESANFYANYPDTP